MVVGRTRLWASLEGLAVAGLGLFMLVMAFGQDYWMLLNPKFRWLTGSSGGLLLLVGLAVALAAGRRAGPWRTLALAALLSICLAWDQGAFTAPGMGEVVGPFSQAQKQRIASRETWEGREYVKINLAELFLLAENGDPAKVEQNYVFRAQVVETPNLRSHGHFAAVRLSVWCCLADAVWVGMLVGPPEGQFPPMASWVKLYGRLQPRENQPAKSEAVVDKNTNRMSAINQRYWFQAQRVEPIKQPAVPYMFQTRSREPYAY